MSATATKSPSKAEASQDVLASLGLGNALKPAAETTEETNGRTEAAIQNDAAPTESKTEPAAKEGDQPEAKAPEVKVEDKQPTKDEQDLAKLQKQLKDTRDAFTQERQVNKTLLHKQELLEQKIDILTKKIDGTYDEAKDAPKAPTTDPVLAERVATSHWSAVDRYGQEYVMKTVWADDAPFRQFDQDPAIQARIFGSKTPILEAIKVVKESEAKAKYGSDPEAMREALIKELTPQIEKEVRQKLLKGKADTTIEEVRGLGNVRATGDTKSSEPPRLSFETLFPGFVKTAG